MVKGRTEVRSRVWLRVQTWWRMFRTLRKAKRVVVAKTRRVERQGLARENMLPWARETCCELEASLPLS
jgi:hypothetical protein